LSRALRQGWDKADAGERGGAMVLVVQQRSTTSVRHDRGGRRRANVGGPRAVAEVVGAVRRSVDGGVSNFAVVDVVAGREWRCL